MRKFFILSLLLCWVCAPAQAQQESFPFLATVTTERVHIRAGQSTNFETLYIMNQGDQVLVLGRKYSWYKVQLPAKAKSFVSSDYVSTADNQFGEITGSRVNIRAGAGNRHMTIGQLKRGDRVVIFEQLDNGWTRIQPRRDAVGWISNQLLAFETKDVSLYQAQLEASFIKPPEAIVVEVKKQEQPPTVTVKPVAVSAPVSSPVVEPPVIQEPPQLEAAQPAAPVEDKVTQAIRELEDMGVKAPEAEKKKSAEAQTVVKKQAPPKKESKKEKKAVKKTWWQRMTQSKKKQAPKSEKKEAAMKPEPAVEVKEGNEVKKAEAQETPTQQKYPVFERDGMIRASGILIKESDAQDDQIEYALQIDGKPAYHIRGLKYLFDDFVEYEVYLEGMLEAETSRNALPVINVSKIQLIL